MTCLKSVFYRDAEVSKLLFVGGGNLILPRLRFFSLLADNVRKSSGMLSTTGNNSQTMRLSFKKVVNSTF